MSNILLFLPSLLSMVYLMADFHHKWWWYLIFCSIPIIYLCILAHLKKTNELNQEDDTHLY